MHDSSRRPLPAALEAGKFSERALRFRHDEEARERREALTRRSALDALRILYADFHRVLGATTDPGPDGSRIVRDGAHVVALNAKTAELAQALAHVMADTPRRHGVSIGGQLPDGRPMVSTFTIGGNGADAMLVAAMMDAASIAFTPGERHIEANAQNPGAAHPRWRPGDAISEAHLFRLGAVPTLLDFARQEVPPPPEGKPEEWPIVETLCWLARRPDFRLTPACESRDGEPHGVTREPYMHALDFTGRRLGGDTRHLFMRFVESLIGARTIEEPERDRVVNELARIDTPTFRAELWRYIVGRFPFVAPTTSGGEAAPNPPAPKPKRRRRRRSGGTKALTAIQQEAFEVMTRHGGNSRNAAAELGKSPSTVLEAFEAAKAKLGAADAPSRSVKTRGMPTDGRGQANVSSE